MRKSIGQSLSELRARSGLTLSTIARAAGYSGPSSVQAYFHPNYDPPGLDLSIARKLAAGLVGTGSPEITSDEIFSLLRIDPILSSAHIEQSSPKKNFLDTDVPVFETRPSLGAKRPVENIPGLSLCLVNFQNPLRYYPRAAGLAWNAKAFALHMVGHSMTPRFRDGEPLFISGSRSPAFNDDVMVVVRADNEESALDDFSLVGFGCFVEHDAIRLAISQYGSNRTVSVQNRHIERIERIASWAEVCGLPSS